MGGTMTDQEMTDMHEHTVGTRAFHKSPIEFWQ